eukprot:scaffold24903_cov49-Attheya_sp.AAC.2
MRACWLNYGHKIITRISRSSQRNEEAPNSAIRERRQRAPPKAWQNGGYHDAVSYVTVNNW